MKKVIKNYLAKLQENEKKGFSLVELIIVMAIMAILVGVVASQVIPYMEKSRVSKDQEALASLQMDLSNAYALSGEKASAGGSFHKLTANISTEINANTYTEFTGLRSGIFTGAGALNMKFKSKAASGADVYYKVDESTGEFVLMLSTNGTSAVDPKLSVTSKSTAS